MTPLDFSDPTARSRGMEASVVPMINVVFLLLIFFLMSAQIAPSDAQQVELPKGVAEARAEPGQALSISADGTYAYGEVRGEAALAAVPQDTPLVIRADAQADGTALARALTALAARGVDEVTLTVARP